MPPRGTALDRRPEPVRHAHPPVRLLTVLGVVWLAVILGVSAVLATSTPSSVTSQLLGSLSILTAILFCLVSSVLAARRRNRTRLGWSLIAVGMALGAVGQLGWVATALSDTQSTPSTLADTLAFLGYILPTLAAVFAFPRRSELLISRFRQVLDVLVITVGVLLISEATVLGSVLELTDLGSSAGWLHLAYLVGDIAICALVLCLGMRQLPGDRMTWFVLGSGLLVVAISDSIYVSKLAAGESFLLATPLAAGWILGPVLIGLASYIPMTGRVVRARDYTLALQLLPYGPVIGALVILVIGDTRQNPFLLATAALLLVAVACRQVMIVYENVSLTRDLEAKVASRTAELTTLGSIVTSSTDAIVGVDRDNKITSWNPAATRLYGYPASAVMGRSPEMLLPAAGPVAIDLLGRADRGEELDAFEITWERPDGSSVPIAMTVSPIVGADGVEGISVFAQDITQRRRQAEALERAREEALASSRLKSEFLATMSHEIRTPMNAVIGLTSLLLETELDATQRTYAEGVQSAGDALLTVIDDILDFSKLEAGKVVLDQQDFSPRQLVEDVGALLAPAASAKGIELIAYSLPEVPGAVHGDAGRIRQILLNLASNAVKFTPRGEVVIKASAASTDRDRTRLRFDVIDTGIGIAEKDQSRLFESFSQADASTTRRFGGTGLGLAISRRLVEVMGGTISLESEVDVGSTFSFEVTLRNANRPEPSIEEMSDDLLVGLRVLVVDDNATNRTLLKTQLESWGLRTDLADTAHRAFEILRSAALQGNPYDLVATDAHMPDTDGLQLAQRVVADPVLVGTPMIMLTSGLYPEPQTMRDAGIAQWLPKPVRSADLFDRLMRLMAPRERELAARRAYADAGQPRSAVDAEVLVVDPTTVSRIVAKRLISGLGFAVHAADDARGALEQLEQHDVAAVLITAESDGSEELETVRAIRQWADGASAVPVIMVATHPTGEDRERFEASGIAQVISRPLDSVALAAVLAETVRADARADRRPERAARVDTDEDVLDRSRLEDLAELSAPDGTNLMVSMVESYARRSAERAETLRRAAAEGDRGTVEAVAHELKGAAGTIGAQRVMRHAALLEQGARSGQLPGGQSVAELITEMETAVSELTALIARPEVSMAAAEPAS